MTANNFVVNTNKAIALNISPNMSNNNDTLPYVLNGETACSSNSAKCLGITINNHYHLKLILIILKVKLLGMSVLLQS